MRSQLCFRAMVLVVSLLTGCAWGTAGNHIYNKNDGNVGIGTETPEAKLTVIEVSEQPVAAGTVGIKAETSTVSRATAVYGASKNPNGVENNGGYFTDGGTRGAGVWGVATNVQADDGSGGVFHSQTKKGHGVIGLAANTGEYANFGGRFDARGKFGVGIWARGGPEGSAAQFRGNVHIGSRTTGGALLELGEDLNGQSGVRFPDGTVQTTAAVGVTGWQVVERTSSANDDEYLSAWAQCPSGKKVLGGGFWVTDGRGRVDRTAPGLDGNKWAVAIHADTDIEIIVYAVCAAAAP